MFWVSFFNRYDLFICKIGSIEEIDETLYRMSMQKKSKYPFVSAVEEIRNLLV